MSQRSNQRGADLLASAMRSEQVNTVFSLSGNQIMPLYDAFLEVGISVIHTRHEGASVFMAEAFAQLSGQVGVALVTAAPGFGNALGALYSARMSESPVVFLSGDSSVSQDGSGAFQEFPQADAIRPFVKHTRRIMDAQECADAFHEAVQIALSGRRGPVHLSLPFDVLNAIPQTKPVQPVSRVSQPSVNSADVERLIDSVARSQRPLLVAGPSMSRTRIGSMFDELSNAFDAPLIALESPRGLNDPALGGLAQILNDVDTVVYLGKRPDFMLGFGQHLRSKTCVAVDADQTVLNAISELHGDQAQTLVNSEPVQFARECIGALDATGAQSAQSREDWRKQFDTTLAIRVTPEATEGLASHTVAAEVNSWLSRQPEPILIIDGGEFGQWAQANATSPRRLINGPSGAIGGSLPYAIAAKASYPASTVIALMGDGTAGFHLSEFETAARQGLNIIVVIGNDARWNAEHLIQVRDFGADRTFACELHEQAAYEQVAVALGGYGARITEATALAPALDAALSSGKPACLNVIIEGLGAPVVNAQTVASH